MIKDFEIEIANFFGSPYAVATDCCTHALELSLRYTKADHIMVPKHTYISVPLLSKKLDINMDWCDNDWKDYYYITDNIIDAAVLWERDSYISNTFMCISKFKDSV